MRSQFAIGLGREKEVLGKLSRKTVRSERKSGVLSLQSLESGGREERNCWEISRRWGVWER